MQSIVLKIFTLILFLSVFFIKKDLAQNADYPWTVQPSYSLLQYSGEIGNQFFKPSQRNDGLGISFSRFLDPSFDLILGVDYHRLNLKGSVGGVDFYSKGNIVSPVIGLQYKFHNNYLLSDSTLFKPYVGLGFNYLIGNSGGFGYDNNGDFSHFVDEVSLNLSVGTKIKITQRVGFFVELSTKLMTTDEIDGVAINSKNDKFMNGRIGFVIRLGGPKDDDYDGITNDKDECPDTPFGVTVDEKGCPLDKDTDGVPDYQDDCPDVPGLPEFRGCPDTDGDGIKDKDDDCPDLPGLPQYKGCPDSDGDGVIDPKDLCPDTPLGVKVDDYGCPIDSDGDGLTDDVDQCPEEYGPMEYLGCPEPSNVGWPSMDKDTPSEVYFETDKYEIDPEAEEEIQKLVKFLVDNPNMNIRLYGFADPRGTKEHNEVLSAKRVESVKKQLIRKGIPEHRIAVRALGEQQELKSKAGEDNQTMEQKYKKYRKVQFDTYFFMR